MADFTDEYLLLDFTFGQNPRYFEDYITDVRDILQFSEEVEQNGSEVIRALESEHSDSMCIHVRMTDFIIRNISTDFMSTVIAANRIARKKVNHIGFIASKFINVRSLSRSREYHTL
ncbi:unnamed protein product [Strongylus vulgaris]|uniref:Uncharacterized protein n=1 Tax=Strongylus vulgaris TaxID=40348 RepID=A0A3P7IPW5_STRVU|nr:unnamed protein product [Strongylus vulgaris]